VGGAGGRGDRGGNCILNSLHPSLEGKGKREKVSARLWLFFSGRAIDYTVRHTPYLYLYLVLLHQTTNQRRKPFLPSRQLYFAVFCTFSLLPMGRTQRAQLVGGSRGNSCRSLYIYMHGEPPFLFASPSPLLSSCPFYGCALSSRFRGL
jgi:hypothetical protein